MREIKFRAWDKTHKKMHTGSELMICFNGVLVLRNEADLKCIKLCNSMYEIMQFTGLKDKNGKEIYEGDIVKVYDDNLCFGQIMYYQNSFDIFDIEENYLLDLGHHQLNSQVEVIGNIYENPELLKEVKP